MLPIENPTLQSVKQMLDGGEKFTLLDCREPSEVATARIVGSTHIPDEGDSGPAGGTGAAERRRSSCIATTAGGACGCAISAAARLRQCPKMAGGIDAWSLEIDPTVPRYE